MRLKVKFSKWSAGIPGAMLNTKTAEKIGVHARGRISLRTLLKYPKEVSTVVDTIAGFVGEDEVLVSSETKKRLGLKIGQEVDANIASPPRSVLFIKRKLNKKRLSEKQINEIIKDVVDNSLSEPEISLFISAMYKHGMNFKETVYLIKAILKTGNKLKLRNRLVVDKHSIGGIAGNRTTPIVVPICAVTGLIFPKTSSKAITSASGTADVISVIAKVEFTPRDLKKIIREVGAFIVWGGALGMVPADSKIIKIERVLKIDPESQLLASIMSKKLAVGSKYILIDIPYGKTAKVNRKRALKLKRKFEKLGKYFRKNLKCVLTDGSQPIGNGIGPALELKDVIDVLNPKEKGPKDLEEKALFLSSEILELSGKAKKGKGRKMAEEILYSGKAFDKFKQIINAQGGKLVEIKLSKYKKEILAKRAGKVIYLDNKKLSSLARAAGSPVDHYSGIYLHAKVGNRLKKKDKIMTIYAESAPRLREAIRFYEKVHPIKIR